MYQIVIGFVLGAILGSFSKASADRLITGESLRGRSYCPKCRKTLKWYDLFPVISYLLLRGKCRYCQKEISKENLLVEVVLGLIVAVLFITIDISNITQILVFNTSTVLAIITLFFKLTVISVLAIVFLVDLKTGLIPDKVIFPAIGLTIIYLIVSSALRSWIFYQELLANPFGQYLLPPYSAYFFDQLKLFWLNNLWNLLGAIISSSSFILLILITRGKGMGWGDVKFVFLLGLILGFSGVLLGLFIAFLTGALFALGLISVKKKKFGQTIPFGPFLSLGALISLLFGQEIINWYLNNLR